MEQTETKKRKRKQYQKRVKDDLIAKIQYLYYKRGLTIRQIAELLLMNERTISKYLIWESKDDN